MRSYDTGKPNKKLCGPLMVCMFVMLISLMCCSTAFAAGETAVRVPYTQTYDAAGNRTSDVFTYRIKAVDGAPMPEGSEDGVYDFSIKGVPGGAPQDGMLELKIPFAGAGEYEYEVSSYVAEALEGFTYDKSSYKLRIYVKDSGKPQLVILNEKGKKCESLAFSVAHDAEVLPPEKARPTTTPAGDGTVPDEGVVTDPAGGGRTLRRAGAPANNAAPADGGTTDTAEPQPAPTESLDDSPVPKALQQTGNWALLNLIFAILTILIAAELLRRFFERVDTEDDEYIIRREGGLRLTGIIPAAAAIVMEAVTQDFTKPMVLFDDRVWIMVALLAVEVVIAMAVYVRYDRGGGAGGRLEEEPA